MLMTCKKHGCGALLSAYNSDWSYAPDRKETDLYT